MAFNIDYLGRVNSSANDKALRVFAYNGTSTGSNEALATIVASGYFNNLQQNLTSGSEAGPLKVNDVILVHGNDARGFYYVSSVTTNVALADFQTGSIVNADIAANAAIAWSKMAALNSALILVGNGSNVATPVAMSGDATIDNAGALTIAALAVETSMLANDAVDNSKLADNAVSLENLDAGITPSHVVKYAGQLTTVGGAAAEAFTVTGVAASDLAFVQMVNQGTGVVTALIAVCTLNTLTVTFSANPQNDAVFNYQILRAAA